MTFDKRGTLILTILTLACIILILSNIIMYSTTTFLVRVIIIITFLALLSLILCIALRKTQVSKGAVFTMYFLFSFFCLTWRSGYFTSEFMENLLNSETTILSMEYANQKSLNFNTPHSYFFLNPLIKYYLCSVAGFSVETCIYLSLTLYGLMMTLTGILIYQTLRKLLGSNDSFSLKLLSHIIAFMAISFAYNSRCGRGTDYSLLLVIIILYFIFSQEFKNRGKSVTLLFLILGITLGNTNGILILVPFFMVFSVLKKRTAIMYALIPISYLLFCAYSYTLSLATYPKSVIGGLMEFLNKLLQGEVIQRVVPWGRTSIMISSDAMVCSYAYLFILIISLVLMVILFFGVVKNSAAYNRNGNLINIFQSTSFVWLLAWFIITAAVYVGASVNPESPSSDIRSITLVLLSLMLPFLFIPSITHIKSLKSSTAKKTVLAFLILSMTIASVRAVYEVYPKSISDPILVVEDDRTGLRSIYAISEFVNNYYTNGEIIADYKVLVHVDDYLSPQRYKTRFMNEINIKMLTASNQKIILVYTLLGMRYPSIYHTPTTYITAENFTANNNRIYDNGIITIGSCPNVSSP